MNRMKLWFALAGIFAAFPLVAQQQRQRPARAEVEVRRWRPTLDADWRFGGTGDSFDPSTELGVESQQAFSIHSTVSISRRLRVRLSRVSFSYDSEAPATSPLSIQAVPVGIDETVTTRLELVQLAGGVEFDLVHSSDGFLAVVGDYAQFRAEPSLRIRGVDLVPPRTDLRLPAFGIKTRLNLTPALFAGVEATGMKREADGVYTDFTASVGYGVTPNIYISYGYRNLYARDKTLEPTGDRGVYRLRSSFVGVLIRF